MNPLALFGVCSHRRTTFPQTPKNAFAIKQTYVCCLDCGKEFAYDWQTLKRGAELPQRASETRVHGEVVGVER